MCSVHASVGYSLRSCLILRFRQWCSCMIAVGICNESHNRHSHGIIYMVLCDAAAAAAAAAQTDTHTYLSEGMSWLFLGPAKDSFLARFLVSKANKKKTTRASVPFALCIAFVYVVLKSSHVASDCCQTDFEEEILLPLLSPAAFRYFASHVSIV